MTRLSLTLALLLTRQLCALDPARQPWHYGYSQWQDRDGLPQNTVQAIAQTTDGYLWLGTEGGLVRFNGRTFRTYDTSNEPALRSNSVTSLAAAADGSLWVGTRAGLLQFRAGRFHRIDGVPNETIRALTLGPEGTLWAGTNGGVVRIAEGVVRETWNTQSGLSSNAIRSLVAGDDAVFVGTGRGLSKLRGRSISVRDLPRDTVRALVFDRAGRLWVGTESSGLFQIEANRLRRLTTRDGLTSDSIRALAEDRDGNLWIGTVGGGLNRWRDGRIDRLTTAEGLASDHVRALLEDREGSLWIGTEAGGLAQLRNARAVSYTTIDGLRSDFIRAVRGDADGTLWVGTEGGGLHRLQNGRFAVDERLGLRNVFVTALHRDGAGQQWIGTEGNGAFRLGPAGRRAIPTAGGLSDNSVWAIAETRDGTVWLGSSNGLVRVRGDDKQVYRVQDGLRGNSIRSLHGARDGSLWIASRSAGLQRLRDGLFENVELPKGARHAAITSFLEEPGGAFWISSSAGLLHWDGANLRRFGLPEGLPVENLFQVLDDANGRLWVSSSRGIFAVAKRELLAGRRVTPTVLTSADGMRSSECSGDAQPAGWRAPDGALWFATIRGVVRIQPDQAVSAPPPPAVAIEEVAINGQATSHRASPPGNRLFSVRFAALTYLAPEKTRFRYRLDGLDKDWIEGAGAEAVYHGVPPGQYTFRVAAANADGVWSAAATTVPFDVRPHFYQTAWFYALCVAALSGVGYAIHRTRTAGLQREFAAVLGERTRIAREIHDTLLQGFAGASLQLGAIAKRWQRDPAAASSQLEGVLRQIDDCLADARREIGELREGAPNQPFAERLRAAATGATEVEVRGEPRALSAEVEKNLLRIAREAVANAIRHAHAQAIRIRVEFRPGEVLLVACDDGRGISHGQSPEGHFGLVGMRERTELLGGRFTLRSQSDEGTQIEVTLPA